MTNEDKLRASLREATGLIADAVEGRISIEEFLRQYGNFFYYEALDGHEADDEGRRLLQKYADLIALHEATQTQVVDLVFTGAKETEPVYLAAGRIRPSSASSKLSKIARRFALSRWVEELRKPP